MPDSSSEKLVKKVCSNKKGAPKPKYLDPIIAVTQTNDAAIPDLCTALARHLREPSVQVVFKALLVVHNMIRSGGTDNVLDYLAKMDVLRLKSVGQGNFWDSYQHASTLMHYAHYLHARITAYRTVKHDIVRVQAENNRASAYRTHTEGASERARKLRSLTVEKGLLRETKEVQRIIDQLVKCTFYRDDLADECTVLAFRMLTKDLLVLFQAGNEGIINLLEHYFEMSHSDASEALALYKGFCAQTKKVVEYLRYAKDLNNVIDVPIPNLKHAPVSLVAALEEYLQDPNFEANRQEYKNNKDVADGKVKAAPAKTETAKAPAPPSASAASTSSPPNAGSSSGSAPPQQQAIVDFFSSIEENQNTMFNPQTNSPTGTYFQQQAAINPFAARMQQQQQMFPQATGFGPQPTGMGMMQPQQTGFGGFGAGGMQQMQQQPQPFLQPQMTGYNPFRQSVMPQMTGFPGMQQQQQPQQPQQTGFDQSFSTSGFNSAPAPQQQQQQQPPASNFEDQFASVFNTPSQPKPPQQSFSTGTPSSGFNGQQQAVQPQPTGSSTNPFARSQSVPLVSQPTGSKNPFGPPPTAAPTNQADVVGKGPSLMDLAFGNAQQQQQQQQQLQPQQTGIMSSLASDFAFGRTGTPSSPTAAQPSPSFLSDNRATLSSSPQPLQPQRTGFAGSSVQPFKPSSTFGASLLSSLPELPPSPGGAGAASQFGALQPQQTGGAPNPFRSSTLPTQFKASSSTGGLPPSFSGGQSTVSGLSSQPTGGGTGGFGASLFGTSTSPSVATPPASQFGTLQSQPTGMRAPFVPSSSFGQEMQAQKTGAPTPGSSNPFGQRLASQPTGSFF